MTTKAVQATIDLGFRTIEGLLLPDGTYGISVIQAWELFHFGSTKNTASRDLKRIAGEGFSASKTSTQLSTSLQNVMTLEQFADVVFLLAAHGNKEAFAFGRVANIEFMRRRFNTAFEVMQTEEEHNAIAKLLFEHSKQFHPLLTSWWKRDLCGEEPHKFYYSNRVNNFKKANGLRVVPINEYSVEEVHKLNQREAMYHGFRSTTMNHKQAIETLKHIL